MEKSIEDFVLSMLEDKPYKLVISKVQKKAETKYIKINILKKSGYYQAEQFTKTQVFHERIEDASLAEFCVTKLGTEFLQLNSWSDQWQKQLAISKKCKPFFSKSKINESDKPSKQEEHNRQKQYMIPEGKLVASLVDMGIFTETGKVITGKYDKFKQINRFLEIIDDSIKELKSDRPLRVVDFGCGQSIRICCLKGSNGYFC